MISRRNLLTALGLGAGSLFLPSLRGRGVLRADLIEPPKRLIVISTGHGTVRDNWNMRPAGLSGDAVSDWEFPLTTPGLAFSRILAPLAPVASKMLVLEGLAQYPAIAAGGNGHYSGGLGAFTSTVWRDLGDNVLVASGPSVDQIVAKQIARPDRIPSLELGWGHTMAICDDQGIPLPVEGYPDNLFKRLFGQPLGDQSSVLDLVGSQYANLAQQLGKDDRQKLAQHQQLIRDLETRTASLASLKCTVPAAPNPPDFGQPTGTYKTWFDGFTAMVVAAFSCDLTRVVSIQVMGASLEDIGAPPGDIHSDYAHHADDCPDQTALGLEVMTNWHTYDISMIARLAMALDAVPEGNGTMLDNTLILKGGELGSGGHFMGHLPLLLIGNIGGKFKSGRYVHYGQKLPLPGSNNNADRYFVGPPHAKLLTAIAQAFGVNTNIVGTQAVTLQGRSIDLSGALERLS
jgi:hypothetical protein